MHQELLHLWKTRDMGEAAPEMSSARAFLPRVQSRECASCVGWIISVIIDTYRKTQLFYKCSDASESKRKTSPGGERVNRRRTRSLDSQWGNKWKLAAQRKIGVLICQKITDWQGLLCPKVLSSECEFSLKESKPLFTVSVEQSHLKTMRTYMGFMDQPPCCSNHTGHSGNN